MVETTLSSDHFSDIYVCFMIGYHLGVCNPIKGSGETRDFAPISQWKPMEISDYVLMLVLSESDENLGSSGVIWKQ